MSPYDQSARPTYPEWSNQIEPELRRFCKEQVYDPWCKILEVSNQSHPQGTIPPIFGLGPAIPARLLPLLLNGPLIRTFLGNDPNMITVILNRAHNHIVFLAAERTEHGRYVEMIRLDTLLPTSTQQTLCRLLQTGEEADALDLIRQALDEHDLSRFRPGLLKIADLYFFEAFHRLSLHKQPSLAHLKACFDVAQDVLSHRLLYFYPHNLPFERLLGFLRTTLRVLPVQTPR
ncbi:hypothetical protein L6R29_13450 [Myxococcota bacterium]|nr:hypothetical protein [Myxococcota bacterium]